MGLFKQLKDMKNAVAEAPGIVSQAQQMAVSAQAFGQAQQSQAQQMAQAMAFQQQVAQQANPELLVPIAGVDLPTYAWVVKQIAPRNYDQSLLPSFAAQRGIAESDWKTAMDGWALRMNDPALAAEFRRHYDAA